MPKYLLQVSYTASGAQGVMKEGGSSRRDTVAKLLADAGGTLDEFYFTFGEDDVITIVDLPDHASVAALSMTIGASGAASVKTTVLLTPEEIDQAADARCRTGRPVSSPFPRLTAAPRGRRQPFDPEPVPARTRRAACRGEGP